MTKKTLAVSLLLLAWAAPLPAEIMTYQGRLKDNSLPANGNYAFAFDFCDVAQAACFASTDNPQNFLVSNGLFKSTFTMPSVDLASQAWYLRVSVGGTALAPMERLTAVPYSVYASSAGYSPAAVQKAGDFMSGQLTLAGSTLTVQGNAFSVGGSTLVVKSGLLGLGTGVPGARLDVLAAGSGPDSMTQIWRDGTGAIISSVSATGVMMGTKFVGDGSGLTNVAAVTGSDSTKVLKAGDTMQGALDMNGNYLSGVSTVTLYGNSLAIVPPGTGGTNSPYGISIGSNSFDNYKEGVGLGYDSYGNYASGVGVGSSARGNSSGGVGVGLNAHSNSSYGVGVGADAYSNYDSGVGVGRNARGNSGGGVGVGYNAYSNHAYGVGVGAGAVANYNFGVGVGANAGFNDYYAVGVGAYSQNNAGYGSALGAYSYASSSGTALGAQAKANAELSLALGYGTVNDSTGTASFGGYAVYTSSSVGIGAPARQARLDVQSAAGMMAQVWRDTSGVIVSSVNPAGYLQAVKFIGDGSGLTGVSGTDGAKVMKAGDTMTGQLTNTSSVTISGNGGQYGLEVSSGVSLAGLLYTNNGSVGIGTGSPDQKLNVAGSISQTGVLISSGAGNNYFAGNVGIGSTGPVSKFDVSDGSITVRGTAAGVILDTASRRLLPETDAGLGAGIRVSTNVYMVGFASATKYFGDGSGLTGVTASQIPASGVQAGALGSGVMASSVALAGFYSAPAVRSNLGLAIGADVQAYDADLDDLADGSLTGSKVGTGVPAANIAAGSLDSQVIASSIAVSAVQDASIVGVSGSKVSGNIAGAAGLNVLKSGDTMTGQLTLDGSTLTVAGNAFSVGGSTLVVKDGAIGIGVQPNPDFFITVSQPGEARMDITGAAKTAQLNRRTDRFEMLSGDVITFAPNGGVEAVRVSAAGSVGIGTAGPDQKLTVAGNISQTGVLISSGTGNSYFAGNVGIGTAAPGAKLEVAGGSVTFRGSDSNSAIAGFTDAGGNYKVVVSTTGSVGIGTAAPGAKLDIVVPAAAGAIRVQTASSASDVVTIKNETTNEGTLQLFNDGLLGTRITATGNHYFKYGRLGIGTAGPDQKLTVAGNISQTGVLISSGTGNSYFAGNVGIGTAAPGAKLHTLANGSDSFSFVASSGTDTGAYNLVVSTTGSVGIGLTNPGARLTLPYNGYLGWDANNNGDGIAVHRIGKSVTGATPLEFINNGNPGAAGRQFSFKYLDSELLTILNGGNVGIGTTAPEQKLTVAGNISQTGVLISSGTGNNYFAGNVGIGTAGPGAKLHAVETSGANSYVFVASTASDPGAYKMVVSTTGNVGIGTASPGAKLSFGTSLANTKLAVYDDGTAFYGLGIQSGQFRFHIDQAANRFSFLDSPAGNEIFTIQGSGSVGIGTSSPGGKLEARSSQAATAAVLLVSSQNAAGMFAVQGDGNVRINTAGAGIQIAEGTNARMGTEALVSGARTVSNTSVTANTRIFLTIQDPSANVGALYVSTRTAGADFTIKSTNASDTSTVAWLLIEP